MCNTRIDSQQDSSVSVASISIFENVLRRVWNNYQPLQPMMPVNVPNQHAPPVVYIEAIDLARGTMATVMSEKERYKKSRDIIKHAKKCGAHDFYGTLDPGQADKWVKIMEKAFITLQLSDEDQVSNVYGLMFDQADDQLTRVRNLYGEAFTYQVFKEEFNSEYLTKTFQKQKRASFVNLVQGSMTVRQYTDKFEEIGRAHV